MKNNDKSNTVVFHINPIKNKDNVYVFIPKKFWETDGISKAIKEAIDIVFFDEKETEQN